MQNPQTRTRVRRPKSLRGLTRIADKAINYASSVTALRSASRKKWVKDTEEAQIEDRSAWAEKAPICNTKEASVCNICGAGITGDTSAHGKERMKTGEGSGITVGYARSFRAANRSAIGKLKLLVVIGSRSSRRAKVSI